MTSSAKAALWLSGLFLVAPIIYSCWQWLRGGSRPQSAAWDWRLTLKSTLAFALAFNLVFFIQEFFLVLPKAITPGLEPTLFHNNHLWRGHHSIVDLLQGTGALATVITGVFCSLWLVRRTPTGDVARLVVFWLALLGILSALPQVVIGTVILQNDVGRAMTWLHFTAGARLLASLGAFFAMAWCTWRLTPYLLSMAGASVASRSAAAIRLGVLPCLFAIPLIVAFRIPNAAIEVLLPPCVDASIAAVWILAAAWHAGPIGAGQARTQPIAGLLIALICLLAFFQLVLRRGIDFF
ncbi:MAG TPA: hypothetical protein VFU13_22865 [Steroidobacteraceae bacterium]|nr:hypothetical protein [Steroidobacteraceae bacterium]